MSVGMVRGKDKTEVVLVPNTVYVLESIQSRKESLLGWGFFFWFFFFSFPVRAFLFQSFVQPIFPLTKDTLCHD